MPSGRVIGQLGSCTDRIVKYIANSPAKNMSSLDNQTIVPTLTMLGRVRECTLLASNRPVAAVDVTFALCPPGGCGLRTGSRRFQAVICGRGAGSRRRYDACHDASGDRSGFGLGAARDGAAL